MSEFRDEFGDEVGSALNAHVEKSVPPRHPSLVPKVAISSANRRVPLRPRWVPVAALGVVAALAVLGLSRPTDPPKPSAPSIANADPARTDVSPQVDVVQVPASGVRSQVLEAGATTVGGVEYLVSIGRIFDWPKGLVAGGTATYEGEKRTVYRIPGVSARTALLMETKEGEGDQLGAYPTYLVLNGSDDSYAALCKFVKPGKTLTQCEDASP